MIGRLDEKLTITAWVKIEDYSGAGGIAAKRRDNVTTPFSLSVGKNGELGFEGNNGAGWDNPFSAPNSVPKGEWFYLAFTCRAGGGAKFFVNAKQVAARKVSHALAND